MKLSIVSVFCDNDYQLLPELINNIKSKVNITYEIVLIDNREIYKNEALNIPGEVRVYSQGYNTYQFEARRFSVQFCNGDYIWFIDSDDQLMNVPEELESIDGNLVCFKYAMKTEVLHIPKTRKQFISLFNNDDKIISISKEQIEYSYNFWDIIGCTLWNKWIKKDYFKDLIKDIPNGLVIVASEDILYSAIAYYHTEYITLANYSVYIYNLETSKGSDSGITKERFFHIIKGRKLSRELFRKYFKDAEKYDSTSQSAAYFLVKIIFCKSEKLECMEEMLNHFTEKEIKKGLNHKWVSQFGDKYKKELQELLASAKQSLNC